MVLILIRRRVIFSVNKKVFFKHSCQLLIHGFWVQFLTHRSHTLYIITNCASNHYSSLSFLLKASSIRAFGVLPLNSPLKTPSLIDVTPSGSIFFKASPCFVLIQNIVFEPRTPQCPNAQHRPFSSVNFSTHHLLSGIASNLAIK